MSKVIFNTSVRNETVVVQDVRQAFHGSHGLVVAQRFLRKVSDVAVRTLFVSIEFPKAIEYKSRPFMTRVCDEASGWIQNQFIDAFGFIADCGCLVRPAVFLTSKIAVDFFGGRAPILYLAAIKTIMTIYSLFQMIKRRQITNAFKLLVLEAVVFLLSSYFSSVVGRVMRKPNDVLLYCVFAKPFLLIYFKSKCDKSKKVTQLFKETLPLILNTAIFVISS